MYCLRTMRFRENMTTHMTCASLKTGKSAYCKGQRLIGITYDTIIYRITQLHVQLRVEPHLKSCSARLQMLRNGSSYNQTLERLSDEE